MNEHGVEGLECSELVQANVTLKHDIERATTHYIQGSYSSEESPPEAGFLVPFTTFWATF